MKKSALAHYVRLLEKENETVNIYEKNSVKKSQSAAQNITPLLSKQVSGLYSDSRKCRSGGIFFCKGRHFLKEYLTDALRNGAIAVVYEKGFPFFASPSSVSPSPASTIPGSSATLSSCPTLSIYGSPAPVSSARASLSTAPFSAFPTPVPHLQETDESFELYRDRIFIEVKNIRKAMALLAAFHYGYPMRRAVTVAVTGTKGKTSTVTGIKDVLNENPNFKAIILNDALPSGSPRLTTPEPIELHAAAARCIEHNATHIICEISSQGVKELRTYGIVFDLACFLNFGKDHVSPAEHPTLDDYFLSKAQLFSFCKRAVVNLDSEKGTEILRVAGESKNILVNPLNEKKEIFTFSTQKRAATFFATVAEENKFGSRVYVTEKNKFESRVYVTEKNKFESRVCIAGGNEFKNRVCAAGKKTTLRLYGKRFSEKKRKESAPLYVNAPGRFSVQNALMVFSVCRVLGCTKDEAFKGVLLSKAEGRMEIFDTADGKVRVIVDYAHNKMSFEALFETASAAYNGYPPKITAIFGCSGEKAYSRRYDLPEVALRYCDRIIICEDDSGREPFESIKNEILTNISKILKHSGEGYVKNAGVSVIQSRKRAIDEAVKNAFESGERRLIVFTGRGRENTMYLKNGETPVLSDVSATLKAIKKYDSRLSLDTVFSGLYSRRGDMLTVSFENHDDIIGNFAASSVRLLRAGIIPLAVCGEESAETLREHCYKNGVAAHFISYKTDLYKQQADASPFGKSQNATNIRSIASASAKRGALTVAVVRGDVKKAAAEISVREKSDALVYLTRSGGIILNGKPFQSVISEKNAALISEKIDSPFLKLACTAVSGGVNAVAIIDGRINNALAFFGTGADCGGTVIKKEKTKL